MKLVHFVVAFGVAMSLLSGRAEEVDTLPAQGAAMSWLLVVDSGAYGESWDKGAEVLRKAVTRENWEKALVSGRAPLGTPRSRKVRSVVYTSNLPNAPPGEYVVIQYDAQFENRPSVETIVPMKEKDGNWRISGYFIK